MTSIYESHIDRDEDVENVVECIEDLAELGEVPNRHDHGQRQNLPQEVRNGPEKLQQAVGMLVSDGPDILWAFAKATEIIDKVGQRLEKPLRRPRPHGVWPAGARPDLGMEGGEVTKAFPFHEDCYKWPRVAVFTEDEAAELNVTAACATVPVRVQPDLGAFPSAWAFAVGHRMAAPDGRPLHRLEPDHRGDHDRRLNVNWDRGFPPEPTHNTRIA